MQTMTNTARGLGNSRDNETQRLVGHVQQGLRSQTGDLEIHDEAVEGHPASCWTCPTAYHQTKMRHALDRTYQQNLERGRFKKVGTEDAPTVWLWNQATPSPSRIGEGENDVELLKNDLFDLAFPRWHFFLLPICKIDDQMIWLFRGAAKIDGA